MLIAHAAIEKKAEDIVIMDMRATSGICDYFVIASAESTTRVKAISDNILKTLSKNGIESWHREGAKEALWVLVDYGDVVCHIFYAKVRIFYDLERLWADSPKEHIVEKCIPKKSKTRFQILPKKQ